MKAKSTGEGFHIGVKNLDKIFNPKSIAVIGASNRRGTIGHTLMRNLIGSNYEGVVFPVTGSCESVQGVHVFNHVFEIPRTVDLALISDEVGDVEETLTECAEAGMGGAIIYSSDIQAGGIFKVRRTKIDQLVSELTKEYGIRFLGPNTYGFVRPTIGLNAGLFPVKPLKGNVTFISQSNGVFSSILDWCAYKGVGFSSIVSVGSMVDVNFADLLDYFGMDIGTRSIMIYLEALCEFRDLMSSARHYAKTKPIIVVKAAKYLESAMAAESHTGSLTTTDDLYEASFKRAGLLRVDGVLELFDCSSALAMQPKPLGNHFAVLTNAGGPGILCTDEIRERGGHLATLKEATISKLDELIGGRWNRANPISLDKRAGSDEYHKTLAFLIDEQSIDGIVVIHSPSSEDTAEEVAKAVVEANKGNVVKPVLTAWLGRDMVRSSRQLLEKGGIPSFETPEKAADTIVYMHQHSKNLEDLYETPEDILEGFKPDKARVNDIIQKAVAEDRVSLTEHEALQVLEAYGIPTVRTKIVRSIDECMKAVDEVGLPIALKVLSPQIIHKSEVGGVILNITTKDGAAKSYEQIVNDTKKFRPDAEITGIMVQPMASGLGYEVIVGLKRDECFGPAVLFGAGGVMVELIKDRSVGFPPLNQSLARRMIGETKMNKVLSGFRNRPPAARRPLEEALVKVSYLAIDFPSIMELDVNPVFVDDKGILALDAALVIDHNRYKEKISPGSDLIISLYPTKYNSKWRARDGTEVRISAIRPEDEPLWKALLESTSKEAIRNRFFAPVLAINRDMAVRYCHIDYDREMAITMKVMEDGKERMIGIGRLIYDPDRSKAEFALLVSDQYQGKGMGGKLLDTIIEIGKDKGIKVIWGDVLRDNRQMMGLCHSRGFVLQQADDEEVAHLLLELD